MPESELFAAQVVLAGAPDDPSLATAQQIESLRPEPSLVEDIKRLFEMKGFKTGPMVGFSFSIEGSAGLFREAFGVDLIYASDGSVREKGEKARTFESLPLGKLSPALRRQLKSVLFSAPPSFGPSMP